MESAKKLLFSWNLRSLKQSRYRESIINLSRRYSEENYSINGILHDVQKGVIDVETASKKLQPMIKTNYIGDFAKIDISRSRRTGFPEIVYASEKAPDHLRQILERMINFRKKTIKVSDGQNKERDYFDDTPIIASRVSREKWEFIKDIHGLKYYEEAKIVAFQDDSGKESNRKKIGNVSVLCAGTSDVSIAEECAVLLELCVVSVERYYDVGVAGLHRLLAVIPTIQNSHCAICIAGMDGAMPSVVAGLVTCPVVAVPTSVGYGAAFHGVAPLLTMLNACAPGVSVVNIDNGFGAAAMAVKILNMRKT